MLSSRHNKIQGILHMILALPVTHCLPLGLSLNSSWPQFPRIDMVAALFPSLSSRKACDKRFWYDKRPKVF